MYKVLLVDDEPWALVSTKHSFDWEKHRFEVSMETSNPFEALEILCSRKIHAAFVDIRMPGISGLELVKAARDKGIDTEFVITSGYAEFSYAQESIREGVFEYCLKPIQPDITDPLLERLSARLESKQIERDLDLYDRLAKERRNAAELLAAEHFDACSPFFQVVDIRLPDFVGNEPVPELPGQSAVLSLWLGRHRNVRIVNGSQSLDSRALEDVWNNSGAPGLHIGISSAADNISDIARLIREAEIAANRDFVDSAASVSMYAAPNLPLVNDIVEKLFKNFGSYSASDLLQITSRIPVHFTDSHLGFEEAFYFWNQARAEILKLNCAPALLRELELLAPEELAYRFEGLEDLCRHLGNLLSEIKKKETVQADTSGVNDSFLKLLDHIRKNYASELYLKDLADDFHINFTYCCDLFKKVTAMTFSQFLAEIRMNKARELLAETGIPIEEVGISVGFRDYHYFISVFKRHIGQTPSQYRKENQGRGVIFP